MIFTYLISFASGILTALSPCVLPLLPIILASGIDGDKKRVKGTIVGIITSFSIAILLLSSIVTALQIPEFVIRVVASFVLVIIGVLLIFPIWDKIQLKLEGIFGINTARFQGKGGFWTGFVTGFALGIVWTPCVGPIVSAVATIAAINKLSLGTVLLVISYALGVGLPLWLAADKGSDFTSKLSFFKTHSLGIRKVFGVVIVVTALFILSGGEKKLQTWLLDTLPESWTQISTSFESKFDTPMQKDLTETQTTNTSVINKIDPKHLIQGCFGGKDCIPSIDSPKFETAVQTDLWLEDSDVVFGVNLNGIQRAYPQKILNWHEIVNDKFGNDPIVVTFCPLCGTAVSFVREVNGEIVEFGVSGKLYNSDLVMYDRKEESYWQQATGEAIVGPAARRNESLEWVATTTTTWSRWRNKYPNTQVLSQDTGFDRDYSYYPYGNYEQSEDVFFPTQNESKLLPQKEIVYGINIDGIYKAYKESDLVLLKAFEDVVNGDTIKVVYSESGEVSFTNTDTQQELLYLRGFWFAWVSFYPDTLIYQK